MKIPGSEFMKNKIQRLFRHIYLFLITCFLAFFTTLFTIWAQWWSIWARNGDPFPNGFSIWFIFHFHAIKHLTLVPNFCITEIEWVRSAIREFVAFSAAFPWDTARTASFHFCATKNNFTTANFPILCFIFPAPLSFHFCIDKSQSNKHSNQI